MQSYPNIHFVINLAVNIAGDTANVPRAFNVSSDIWKDIMFFYEEEINIYTYPPRRNPFHYLRTHITTIKGSILVSELSPEGQQVLLTMIDNILGEKKSYWQHTWWKINVYLSSFWQYTWTVLLVRYLEKNKCVPVLLEWNGKFLGQCRMRKWFIPPHLFPSVSPVGHDLRNANKDVDWVQIHTQTGVDGIVVDGVLQ